MTNDLSWKLTNQTTVFKNKWIAVHNKEYILPNGSVISDFNVIEEAKGIGAVTIVALTPEKEIITVKQFRAAIDQVTYDLPGGYIEDTNTPALEHAKRELLEETGYSSENWQELGYFYHAPHRMNTKHFSFLALDCKKTDSTKLDATEFVSVELKTLPEFHSMITHNEFICAICLTAFLKAQLKIG